MFAVHDKNETLQPPEGFLLQYVKPEGEYILVEYRRLDSQSAFGGSYSTVLIYLNSMGREVLRTTNQTEWTQPRAPEVWRRPEISRWYRIKAGFYLALEGIKEMFQ